MRSTRPPTRAARPEKMVTIEVDHVRIGNRIFNPVRMGDVFEMLARSVRKNFGYSAPRRQAPTKPGGKPSDPITAAALYPRYRDFFKPMDRIVLESGSSSSGIYPLPLPDGAETQSAPLWGSIGWATGATLGIALADPSRRTLLFTGEGSHQMTATAVGTMGRYGLKPIIFVLNNDGYMVERGSRRIRIGSTTTSPLGTITRCPRRWAAGAGSLRKSAHSASSMPRWPGPRPAKSASYIEVVGGRMDFPAGLAMASERLDAMYANG